MRFGARVFAAAALAMAVAPILFGTARADSGTTLDQPTARIRRLGADAGDLRFSGESASRTFPVYVTAAEAASPGRLHLSYSKAAVVMAEGSTLKIAVNGVAIATTPIMAPPEPGLRVFDVDLPRGLVAPGFNAVTISVEQRHVVDCSIAATYELWTQVDPAATGFTFDNPVAIADLADLPGLPPEPDGATSIRLIVPHSVAPARVDQLFLAAQALAIRGHFPHPVFSVAAAPTGKPGLDLVVGPSAALTEAGLTMDVAAPAPVTLLPGAVPDNVVLAISGETNGDIETAIHQVLSDRSDVRLPGTEAGLRALARADGLAVSGGSDVSLHAAGVASQEFSGRLFRAAFDLRMPFDFYPADYDKLTLAIDGAYAAGLEKSNQFLVRVNGRDAYSMPLSDPAGAVLRGRPITVPLSKLRPGSNRIQIEAMVAALSDRVCDVEATLDPRRRFLLLDSSRIAVPALARIAHLPSLAATATSGFPYAGRSEPLTVYLPRPGAEAIGAAATVLAQLALAAGQPIATKLVVARPPNDDEPSLIVGALDDLAGSLVSAVGLDDAALRDAWAQAHADAGSEAPQPVAASAMPSNDLLLRDWTRSEPQRDWSADLGKFADGTLHGALQRVFGPKGIAPSLLGVDETPYAPDPTARLLVAQHESRAGSGATWTLVTAPSREQLAAGVGELTGTSRWRELDGAVVALEGPDEPLRVQAPATRYFLATSALTPGNMRLIAAGWLSDHLRAYVAAFLSLCIVVAVMTAAVLTRWGVRN